MMRSRSIAALGALLMTGLAFAQQTPPPVEPQQGSPQQTAEWVKSMHADAMKMIDEAEKAKAKGQDDVALDRYVAAREIYKAALSAEEMTKINSEIDALRTKLGKPDPNAPTKPPKQVDLTNPVISARHTEAMQQLSEAEQYLEEGRLQEAGNLFTRLYSKFRAVLLDEEEARVTQGLMTARERLGLPPLPPGEAAVMPYVVRSGDEEVDALCRVFAGTFATDPREASESTPPLTFNSAAVKIDGVTNAVYFEVSRADDAPHPFRQGLFTFYRLDKQLRLRVLDISNPARRDSLVGLWAASDIFPELTLDELSVNADLNLSRNEDGSGYTARTPGRVPTTKGGAVLMTSQIKVNADGISIDDRGYDGEGKEVWRSGSESGVTFHKVVTPNIVTRKDDGVVIITLVPGNESQKLKPGGQIAMQFSYWAGKWTLVETSRGSNRPVTPIRFPISAIQGLNTGLGGIPLHAWRRIYVPPEQAWGAQGNGWRIPPDSPVIFDIECVWLQEAAQPPAVPPSGAGEQGPPSPKPSAGGH